MIYVGVGKDWKIYVKVEKEWRIFIVVENDSINWRNYAKVVRDLKR